MITDAEAAEIAERWDLTEVDLGVIHDLADSYQNADRIAEMISLREEPTNDSDEPWLPASHPARQMFIWLAAAPAGAVPTAEDLAFYGIDAEHLGEVQAQAVRIAELRRAGNNQAARELADEAGIALAAKVGDVTEREHDPDSQAAQIPRA